MTRARLTRTALIGAAALLGGAAPALAAPGDLSLASLSSAGTSGATAADAAAVSADGRFVAFTSASDLAGVATGGKVQLYVRDRTSGTTALASSSAAGVAADQDVDQQDVDNIAFAISGDGRYVVFASTAANLTPADTDAAQDVFRKDLVTGAVALVSVSSTGAKANAAVFGDPDVSADGNRVSFGSGNATNLFPADGTAGSDIVVRDIAAGTTVLAAQSTGGVQANSITERSVISADGRVVSFDAVTGTSTLVPNEGTVTDIIVRNLATGTTSAATDPTAGTGANFSDLSGDGRYVVFETGQAYDVGNDAGANDIYRRDMGTGAIVLISAKDGADAGSIVGATRPQISADGGRVTFTSTGTDLLATADGNAGIKDVFVRDVVARTTRLASVNGATQGSNPSARGAISPNGGLVAFAFDDNGATTKLVPETNAVPDILVKEFSPSDATGPALTLSGPADGTVEAGDRIAVGGTAADVSGIVSVTVNGTPVALTATGGFSTAVATAVGANAITVRALDGAGNATTIVRTVTRSVPVVVPPRVRARLLALGARLTKAGKISVTIRLSADARVRVSLLRRTVLKGRRPRVVLRTVGSPVTKALTAGRRTVTLAPGRKKLTVGRYVVRVRILTPAAGPAVQTVAFRITAR